MEPKRVFVVAFGEVGQGYTIQSIHANKQSAWNAAQHFMINLTGFEATRFNETELPVLGAFYWDSDSPGFDDRVYLFPERVTA